MPASTFSEDERAEEAGVIMLWGDALSNIPSGWLLCDGLNGTPNLLDSFSKSVPDGTTEPGTSGGSNSITLTSNESPSHSHSSSSTDTVGDHQHANEGDNTDDSGTNGRSMSNNNRTADTMAMNGGHNHTLSVGSVGGDSSFDNRPSYQEVAFIMKV